MKHSSSPECVPTVNIPKPRRFRQKRVLEQNISNCCPSCVTKAR